MYLPKKWASPIKSPLYHRMFNFFRVFDFFKTFLQPKKEQTVIELLETISVLRMEYKELDRRFDNLADQSIEQEDRIKELEDINESLKRELDTLKSNQTKIS